MQFIFICIIFFFNLLSMWFGFCYAQKCIKYVWTPKIYLQCKSSTKLLSLGSTSIVFMAWQVKIELRSARDTAGHSSLFSITSPELCSTSSSTTRPFTNHRTFGVGRPGKIKIDISNKYLLITSNFLHKNKLKLFFLMRKL